MGADIDQRTAALGLFVKKYAPGRNRTAADGLRFGIINLSKLVVLAYGMQIR
ncbi:hypothetical protein D3C75_1375440 [compost metagenome]